MTIKSDQDWGETFRNRFKGQNGQAMTITVKRGSQPRTLQTHVRERVQTAFTVGKPATPTPQQAKLWRGLTTATTGP